MIRHLALTLFVFLAACATSPRVSTDFDQAVDFSRYHTFNWGRAEPPRGQNPILYERVRTALGAALEAKGFRRSDTPDFAVDITLGARDRVETTTLGAYAPYYPAYGMGYRWGWARTYSPTEIQTVTDGTLTVDIYDAGTHRPVWHGRATREIRGQTVDQALIDSAVAAVLANFPPTAG